MSELRRYLDYFRPYWPTIIASSLLLALSAAIPAAAVLVLQQALDHALAQDERAELLWVFCGAFVALVVVRAVVVVCRTWLTKRVAWRVTSDLRRRLHRHLLALDTPSDGLGSRLAALTSEVDEVQYGVSALVTLLRNPLTIAGLAGTSIWLAPTLAPWALLLVPLVAITGWWTGERVRRRAQLARQVRAELSSLLADQLALQPLIRALGATDAEASRLTRADQADRDARVGLEVERVLPSAVTQVAVAGGAAIVLLQGSRMVYAGILEPGALAGFALALWLVHRPLSGLAEVWSLWQRSAAALERVHAVLDLPLPAEPSAPLPLPTGALVLEARGISFGWSDAVLLDGIDLAIRPGEIVALTGPSGIGKSTLLDLLAGWRAPWDGEVRLGGVPLDRLQHADRRAIARVPQEDQLLDRSVEDNLRLADPDATEDALWTALERAGAQFVRDLESGLRTSVGEGGGRLSGGERQRLCLARALLTEPRVILLDEATNQIDPETERAVLQALRRGASDCAVLLVAHDPSTVALADRVLALGPTGIAPAAASRVVA